MPGNRLAGKRPRDDSPYSLDSLGVILAGFRNFHDDLDDDDVDVHFGSPSNWLFVDDHDARRRGWRILQSLRPPKRRNEDRN